MSTSLDRLRCGAQLISEPACQAGYDHERLVLTGMVLAHLDNPKTYVGLPDSRLAAVSSAKRLLFTGWCRLVQREVTCCVEVDRQTLQGRLSLYNSVQTGRRA